VTDYNVTNRSQPLTEVHLT